MTGSAWRGCVYAAGPPCRDCHHRARLVAAQGARIVCRVPLYRAAATGREWRHYLPPPQSNSSDAASYTHTHGITEMQILYTGHLDKPKRKEHHEERTHRETTGPLART